MNKIIAKKEIVIRPELKMKVFHEDIYRGREIMTVVGVREHQVELRGDYSGGTNPYAGIGEQWVPIEGLFRLRKICDQHLKFGMCQLPNVHCGFPECEPYITSWGHYVDGKLKDEVEIQNTKP